MRFEIFHNFSPTSKIDHDLAMLSLREMFGIASFLKARQIFISFYHLRVTISRYMPIYDFFFFFFFAWCSFSKWGQLRSCQEPQEPNFLHNVLSSLNSVFLYYNPKPN